MFRNQYDYDITIWSPQGRLLQLEYAMEAPKQGSAAVGLRSNTHAVLVALKRSPNELATYQKKILHIDKHIGIAIAGLTSDAHVLSRYMRKEALKSRTMYNRPVPLQKLVTNLSEVIQINTQRYGSRPYGVGILVIGCDDNGPHLYECSPAGTVLDYYAIPIGSRSQPANTYLEKHFTKFTDASLDQLINYGLTALRETLHHDKKLDVDNCAIAVVGVDTPFTIIESDDVKNYLDKLSGFSDVTEAQDMEDDTQ